VTKRLVFSGASTARQLQTFVESNIYHRQGFVYGAKENKKLKVFIDDVNLPVPDKYNVQRCNQVRLVFNIGAHAFFNFVKISNINNHICKSIVFSS